jgi:hypothetical protein
MKLATLAITVAVYCSTSFQGYRICTSPDGRTSAEWEWQGMRLGQNSDGDRWTTTPWRDNTITTVTPAPEPR